MCQTNIKILKVQKCFMEKKAKNVNCLVKIMLFRENLFHRNQFQYRTSARCSFYFIVITFYYSVTYSRNNTVLKKNETVRIRSTFENLSILTHYFV